MKFLERISSKGKLNVLTLLALTGGVVLTGATVFCGISLVETKSAVDFNKYNTVMGTKFQEDHNKDPGPFSAGAVPLRQSCQRFYSRSVRW